jgi:hypothetical protein
MAIIPIEQQLVNEADPSVPIDSLPSVVARIRATLLRGEGLTLDEAQERFGGSRSNLSVAMNVMEDLGYRIAKTHDAATGLLRYSISNPKHRPTPAQLEAKRKRGRDYAKNKYAESNGSAEPGHQSVGEAKRGRRSKMPMPVFPSLGDQLTVTMVGLHGGRAWLTVANGTTEWQCSIEQQTSVEVPGG